MTTPPTADTRDGAFLAHALAGALSLGLPDPDYITMHPHLARDTVTSAVSFQFSGRYGRDPLPALQAWAARFGVTVGVSAGTVRPASTWHKFEFTHAGVLFDAYAEITEDAEPDAAAVLAAPVASGQPVITDDEACPATVQDSFGNLRACEREDGHGGSHHAEPDGDELPGIAWSDPGPVTGRDVLLSALADAQDGEPRLPASFLPLDRPTLAGGES